MSTFVVSVFPSEAKAYEGIHVFKELHGEGSITLYDSVVVERQADGTLATKERAPTGGLMTGVGALLGALVGLFGGPAGALIGAAAGTAVGGSAAILRGDVSDEFLEDVAKQMKPGDFAVLAEVSERWTGPIDTRMRELGGTVLRERRGDVIDDLMERRATSHKAEVEARKAERASVKAVHKEAKLDEQIQAARERLQRVADKAQDRLDETRRELDGKLQALDEQAAKATPVMKQEIQLRVAEIRKDFGERQQKLSRAFEIAQRALQ